MRLNVGCGEFRAEGWMNIDVVETDKVKPDLVVPDLTDLPDEIQNLQSVYLGHVLEHMERSEIPRLLRGVWDRCLPGATFAATGPDCDTGRQWNARGQMSDEVLTSLLKGAGRWPGDAHLWDCTEAGLVEAIRESGIKEVHAVAINSGRLNDYPVVSRIGWQCAAMGVVR